MYWIPVALRENMVRKWNLILDQVMSLAPVTTVIPPGLKRATFVTQDTQHMLLYLLSCFAAQPSDRA